MALRGGGGGQQSFLVNRVTKKFAHAQENSTYSLFKSKNRSPYISIEYKVTLTSHFNKADWILHGKSERGVNFFSNLEGDNRVKGGEKGPLSLPEFWILASTFGWGGVKFFL